MSTPRVRRLVLFKHGVAYVERAGPADGPFELAFKRDEMNDVLKSLAVWTGGGAGAPRVGAVAFEKPEDPEAALVRRRLALPPDATLLGLLVAMRGRRVAVELGGAKERLEGEVLGVEQAPDAGASRGDAAGAARTLLLRQGGGVALVDLARVTKVDLLDESARDDLAFFVDRSRAASTGENRIVRVDVTGRCDDLRVSYVVPAPAWRVSYRIARGEDGATTLMAWGIVHNPVEEDLEDLELVLTTGQPVSFVIDLYAPKAVRRAVVEEATRAVDGPTRLERATSGGRAAPPPPMAMAPRAMAVRAPSPAPGRMLESAFAADDGDDEGGPDTNRFGGSLGFASADASATFEDRGEQFEYRVGQRLALKRGGSAMVPLLGVPLEATKERIWRVGQLPPPDLVLAFANATGAVLEEGAAVVYDGDVYAGESMVPYAARGAPVKLAYAKDLSVRCRHHEQTDRHVHAVGVRSEYLRVDTRYEWTHVFEADSDHDEPVELTFELPLVRGRSFVAGAPTPYETTPSAHRFRVTVPPRGRARLDVREQQITSSRAEYDGLVGAQLDAWVQQRLLTASHAVVLNEVLALHDEVRVLAQGRQALEQERERLWDRQRRVNEQLAVLKDSGPEAQLRLRHVKELEETQDALRALDARDVELARRASEAEAAVRAVLAKAAGAQ